MLAWWCLQHTRHLSADAATQNAMSVLMGESFPVISVPAWTKTDAACVQKTYVISPETTRSCFCMASVWDKLPHKNMETILGYNIICPTQSDLTQDE